VAVSYIKGRQANSYCRFSFDVSRYMLVLIFRRICRT
jgi:hypothetical protein